jgi:hypothetical protein
LNNHLRQQLGLPSSAEQNAVAEEKVSLAGDSHFKQWRDETILNHTMRQRMELSTH